MYTIAVTNQKGGVGKTTIAMQVAAAMSRRHRVLLIDTDPQRSTQWWADNVPRPLPFDYAGPQQASVIARLPLLQVEYDFVFVDTPGSFEETRTLDLVLDAADFALVPMTPEPLAVEPTMRTIHRLIEPRGLRYAVVLNKLDPRTPHQWDVWMHRLDTDWGYPRTAETLRRYKAHADAPILGELVTAMPTNPRTAGLIGEVTRLAVEVGTHVAAISGTW
ncbi:ParA family protein [uncultured Microbacterium sp.]|uniref:Putative plasmid partitioning protein n=1 Tax=uncultured Microbacterium sp. TaxID=191216 RepID=A0A1Y5NZW1_9MICO|nr:ParA family protein [uncultured Microbacterium sp.]SBS71905.1 putative plasmid partitioning protein [uncultured Microbacterium sp.]